MVNTRDSEFYVLNNDQRIHDAAFYQQKHPTSQSKCLIGLLRVACIKQLC